MMGGQSCETRFGLIALAAAMISAATSAQGFDETKYPDWSGQWRRPPGVGNQMGHEQASASGTGSPDGGVSGHLRGQPQGSSRRWPGHRSDLYLHPRRNAACDERDLSDGNRHPAKYHTYHDRISEHASSNLYRWRDWPKNAEPSFMGYSIGRWIDEDGRGRYDVLEVETRNLKGPRSFDASGIPSTQTIGPSSRNASTSTKSIRTSFMTKSPRSTTH